MNGGSVSSLSTTSAASAVPSSAGSSASRSGGVKLKSWASIVGKKSSEPVGQVSQTCLATSPHVNAGHSVPGSSDAIKRVGDGTSSHDLTVSGAMAQSGDETQKQFPPLNPTQLANLERMSRMVLYTPSLSLSLSLSLSHSLTHTYTLTLTLFTPPPSLLSPLSLNLVMKWTINHTPVSIQPQGLINQGNWCYMHAVSYLLMFFRAWLNLSLS